MTRVAAATLALLLLAPAPARPADERTPPSAEMLWQIKRLGAPALLPDGQAAVVPVTSYDVKGDKTLTDLGSCPPPRARPASSRATRAASRARR